jgi:hypothetical protein
MFPNKTYKVFKEALDSLAALVFIMRSQNSCVEWKKCSQSGGGGMFDVRQHARDVQPSGKYLHHHISNNHTLRIW